VFWCSLSKSVLFSLVFCSPLTCVTLINPKIIRMPKTLNRAAKVYNVIDFNAYLLSKSTILDNRVAMHLVNSAN
jgi:hypothetical protein